MHVVIVGCGRVGSSLGRMLVADGHSVAVIDRKRSAFARLGDDFVGQTFAGVGFDRELLSAAGIERADAVAAVTNGDNSNILVARVARETFGIERVVARIYDPNRAHIYQRLGIPTVAPALWTTERVMRRLLPGATRIEWTDQSGQVSVVEHHVADSWVDHPVADLEHAGVRLLSVCRSGVATIASRDDRFHRGDIVHLAVPAQLVDRIDHLLAQPPANAR